ncbi:MAG: transcriptional regulator [Calditrichota bacterium]
MKSSNKQKVLELFERKKIVRPKDLEEINVDIKYLYLLLEEGAVQKIGEGLYTLQYFSMNEKFSLIRVSKRIPDGVFCLLTALEFHEMTTQIPHKVWIALENSAYVPKVESVQLRVVRMSGDSLSAGISEYSIEGILAKIYTPAKTVADCFKFRNKIGLDIAIEALSDYIRDNRGTIDELWRYAKICRVQNILRPYLEAMQ